MKTKTILRILVIAQILGTVGCVGIPQRFRDKDCPGPFKCTATDIGAGIYYFPLLTVPALVDLPFGFVVDIGCLPFDIADERRQSKDREFWLGYFDSGMTLSSLEQGKAHLSFLGRETIRQRVSQPSLPKGQLDNLMRLGFAKEVADTQLLDADLIANCIGVTNLLNGTLAGEVARNRGTPLAVLSMMVSNNVALPQLVGNTNLTVDLINRIADVARSNIAATATNTGPARYCGPITHTELLARANEALARHPMTSPEILETLYLAALETPKQGWRSSGDFIMLALVKNPKTPSAILSRITRDGPTSYIRDLARRNLAERGLRADEVHEKESNKPSDGTR